VKLTTRTVGAATVLEPLGSIDIRGAIELEQKLAELMAPPAINPKEALKGPPKEKPAKEPVQLVIDFSGTEVISGAGLRVLVTFSNRLAHYGGAMCLAGLAEHLNNTFEVAGLANHFHTADKVDGAVAQLAALKANAKTPEQQARVITALSDRAILLLEYEASDQPVDPTIVRRAVYAARGRQSLTPLATYLDDLLAP
jgi:anti-anti-sigma regulatory factor